MLLCIIITLVMFVKVEKQLVNILSTRSQSLTLLVMYLQAFSKDSLREYQFLAKRKCFPANIFWALTPNCSTLCLVCLNNLACTLVRDDSVWTTERGIEGMELWQRLVSTWPLSWVSVRLGQIQGQELSCSYTKTDDQHTQVCVCVCVCVCVIYLSHTHHKGYTRNKNKLLPSLSAALHLENAHTPPLPQEPTHAYTSMEVSVNPVLGNKVCNVDELKLARITLLIELITDLARSPNFIFQIWESHHI